MRTTARSTNSIRVLIASLVIAGASLAAAAGPRPAGSGQAGGTVRAISTRTGETIQTYSGTAGEDFGAALGVDTIIRAGQRDLVVGAPGAGPDPGGGSPFGELILFDPATGGELARLAGASLPGGPVRRLGQSAAVLGHPTGSPLSWWVYGAPGTPGTDDVGAVVITGDQALVERYRVAGRPGALLGWRVLNLFEDIDGDAPQALDFVASAPLESRGKRRIEAGAVYAYSTLTGRELYRVAGPHSYGRLGYAMAGAADHDGDGLRDFWVAAPGSTEQGVAGMVLLLASATGRELMRIEAPAEAGQFGYDITSIFDANGDGVRDLLVGAPGSNRSPKKTGTGLTFMFSGADGTELFRWKGKKRGERLGVAVSGTASLAGTEPRILIAAYLKGRGRLDFHHLDGRRARRINGPSMSRLAQQLNGFVDLDGDEFPELLVALVGADPLFEPE